jgi:type II secretory pathway component PulJ
MNQAHTQTAPTETDAEKAERWFDATQEAKRVIAEREQRIRALRSAINQVRAEIDAAEAIGLRYVSTAAIKWALSVDGAES